LIEYKHIPVMVNEVIHLLKPKKGECWVNATEGGGGHSKKILEAIGDEGTLVGIDLDWIAKEAAEKRYQDFKNVKIVQGNFGDLAEILQNLEIKKIDGIIFDLGVSSHQLDCKERGFSFKEAGPIDMRFDTKQELRAGDLVNDLPEEELARILWEFGEERWARKIARRIVSFRYKKRIEDTVELAKIIEAAIPPKARPRRIHAATRSFQALRVVTNSEISSLQRGLEAAIEILVHGGRIGVISYESLSDSIVKSTFRKYAGFCQCPPAMPQCFCQPKNIIKILTTKPVRPSEEEISTNPRARSARLRVAQKN